MKKLFFIGILLPCLISTSEWTGTSGNWNDGGNWSAGVPNAADAVATFPIALSGGARTITLDISPTVGTLTTSAGPYAYTFTPSTSTIHFDGTSPTFTVTNNPGTYNCMFSIDSSTTFSTNSAINVSRGISGSGDLTKSGTGSLVFSGVASSYTGATNLTSGTMLIVASNVLPTTTVMTITGGTLNLNNSNLTVGSLEGTGGTISMSSSSGTIGLTSGSLNTDTEYTGAITGAGKLTKVGSGTLTLSGSSTYSLGTYIQAGAISISANNNLGTGDIEINTATLKTTTSSFSMGNDIALNGSGTLDIDNGITTTLSGTISGSGQLIKTGAGTLILSGANTYTGETTISAGTIQTGAANVIADASSVEVTSTFALNNYDQEISHLGGSGDVTLGSATLTIGASNINSLFMGVISGTGGVTKTGSSSQFFGGVNTYTGPTDISEGTIQLGIANAIDIESVVTVDGTLDLNDYNQSLASLSGSGSITLDSATLSTGSKNTSTTFSGVISETGNLTKLGTGTFTLSGANTYTGATTISAGELKMGVANAISSSSAVTVTSTFNLNDYNQSIGSLADLAGTGSVTLGSATLSAGSDNTSTTFAGVISGSGGFTKLGSGTLTMSGTNTYTGTTTVSAGTLKAGAANILKTDSAVSIAGTYNLNNFNQSIGSLSGTGSVTLGTATLTTGNNDADSTFSGAISGVGGKLTKTGSGTLTLSGTNTYTGDTTVSEGKLSVTGSITSDIVLADGATVGGTGTITGNINAYGTVRPGSSIGTLHVTGNQTFLTGSTYQVEFSPTASDLLDVTGSVTINSGVNIELIPDVGSGSYQPYQQYTIVQTTGGVTGTFANIITDYPSFIGELSYDNPNTIVLTVNAIPFSTLIRGGNPGRVADYIDTLSPLLEGSDLDDIIEKIQLMSLANMRDAFDQMQCSMYKGIALSQESNLIRVRSLVTQRSNDLYRATCIRDISKENSFWAAPFFDYYHQDNNSTDLGFHTMTSGGVIGFDHKFASRNCIGIAGSYTFSNVDWENNKGKSDINSFYGLLYHSWFNNKYFVNSSVFGSFSNIEAHRNISFSSISRTASNQHSGRELGAHIDGGSMVDFKLIELHPFVSVDFLYFRENNFTETGANSLNLEVKNSDNYFIRTELGTHFSNCFIHKKKYVTDLKLSWVREIRIDSKHYDIRMVDQGNYFSVKGLEPNRNIFSPGFSFSTVSQDDRLNFSLRYDGEFAKRYYNNVVSANLSFNL